MTEFVPWTLTNSSEKVTRNNLYVNNYLTHIHCKKGKFFSVYKLTRLLVVPIFGGERMLF